MRDWFRRNEITKRHLGAVAIALLALSFFGPGQKLANAVNTITKRVIADVYEGGKNGLTNPSFEAVGVLNGWTETGSIGVARDGTTVADGKESAAMTITAGTGELYQDFVPVSNTSGVPMVAACRVNTSATDVQVCARAGATDISCTTVASAGSWVLQPVNFTGPANGTSVGVSVKNTVSGSESFNVDDCYVGVASTPQNFGQVAQPVLYGKIVITGCTGNWTSTSTTLAAPTTTPSGCSYAVSGNAVAPASNVDGIKFTSLPPGDYSLEVEGQLGQSAASAAQARFQFNDGTNAASEVSLVQAQSTNTGVLIPGIKQSISYTTAQSNITLQVFEAVTTGATAFIEGGTTSSPLVIKVYRFPTSSEIAYRPDVLPGIWSASLAGTGGGWSTTATGGYGDFTVATTSTTLSSPYVNIGGGSVIAEATKLPAITDQNLQVGSCYTVSASASLTNSATSSSFVRLVDGSGTVIAPGFKYPSGAAGQGVPFTLQGPYVPTSTTATFKLQGMVSGSTATIVQDANAPIMWTLSKGCTAMPAPLLMGSVTSSSTGQEHIERATISSTGSFVSECGSWISGTPTHSTGTYGITAVSGEWSATPTCVCSTGAGYNTGNAVYACIVLPNSSTSISVFTGQATASVDRQFDIICMGPR